MTHHRNHHDDRVHGHPVGRTGAVDRTSCAGPDVVVDEGEDPS